MFRTLALTALAVAFNLVPLSFAEAEPPAPRSAADEKPQPLGALTRQNVDKSRDGFKACLIAARKADEARRAYAAGTGSLTAVFDAEQTVSAAQMRYLATASHVRGNPELRDYLARRGEVTALEHSLESVRQLQVPTADKELWRAEINRYEEALKAARLELAKAERTWKTADRVRQFRYLNRRTETVR